MLSPSQKAICSSRNKSKMAPNEKVFFQDKLGLRSKTWGKRLCFGRESPVFEESMKERRQCTSIFHFADRPEVPYEVDFWRNSFTDKTVFKKIVFGRWFWTFPHIFLHCCNQFGLEPWRKMMRGCWLSFSSNQINWFQFKLIILQGIYEYRVLGKLYKNPLWNSYTNPSILSPNGGCYVYMCEMDFGGL